MNHPGGRSGGEGSTSSRSTSRNLLGRAKAGEAEAWDRLVILYAPLVLHWCRRRDLREQDAADIVQDVFQAVAGSLVDFRKEGVGDTFRGWLRTITENKIRDHYRRTANLTQGVGGTDAHILLAQFPAPSVMESASGDEDLDDGFLHRALELVRDEFEDRTWRAFWQTTVEGRTPKEAGIELAMSPGAVRVAKSRVLRRLREEIEGLRIPGEIFTPRSSPRP